MGLADGEGSDLAVGAYHHAADSQLLDCQAAGPVVRVGEELQRQSQRPTNLLLRREGTLVFPETDDCDAK